MDYITNQKINKKSLLRHHLRVFFVGFLHMTTLHLTTFFKLKKYVEKNSKTIKKRQNRDLNKKSVKNVYYIYVVLCNVVFGRR